MWGLFFSHFWWKSLQTCCFPCILNRVFLHLTVPLFSDTTWSASCEDHNCWWALLSSRFSHNILHFIQSAPSVHLLRCLLLMPHPPQMYHRLMPIWHSRDHHPPHTHTRWAQLNENSWAEMEKEPSKLPQAFLSKWWRTLRWCLLISHVRLSWLFYSQEKLHANNINKNAETWS